MNRILKGIFGILLGSSYFIGIMIWMHYDQKTTKFPMQVWQIAILDIFAIVGIFVSSYCLFTMLSYDDTDEKYEWLVSKYTQEHR